MLEFLSRNPYSSDKATHLQNFVDENWDECLKRMSKSNQYGDHITISAVCRIHNVQFLVMSSLGLAGTRLVSPTDKFSDSLPVLTVGHYSESEASGGISEHYVSLDWRGDTAGSISTFIAETLPSLARDESVDIEASGESSAIEMGDRPTSRNKDGLDTEANITAPLGLTASRFAVWQKNRPWLQVKSDGSGLVYCSYCADVKGLGMHAPERVRIEKAFVDCISVAEVTKKKLKKLNDKISAHGNCISHKYCCEFIAARGKNALENSLKNNRELWYKQNQQKIDVTTRVFRTAYMCCMRYEPFTAQPEILRLQQLNGVDVGRNLYSDHACRNLVCYIGQQMRQKLLHYVLQTSDSAFSLMFDESTSVSTETCLIMYIRIVYANEICNFFLDLVELKSQSGESIADAIVNVLTTYGFTEEILQSRLIGVCTDGASNLQSAVTGLWLT